MACDHVAPTRRLVVDRTEDRSTGMIVFKLEMRHMLGFEKDDSMQHVPNDYIAEIMANDVKQFVNGATFETDLIENLVATEREKCVCETGECTKSYLPDSEDPDGRLRVDKGTNGYYLAISFDYGNAYAYYGPIRYCPMCGRSLGGR